MIISYITYGRFQGAPWLREQVGNERDPIQVVLGHVDGHMTIRGQSRKALTVPRPSVPQPAPPSAATNGAPANIA